MCSVCAISVYLPYQTCSNVEKWCLSIAKACLKRKLWTFLHYTLHKYLYYPHTIWKFKMLLVSSTLHPILWIWWHPRYNKFSVVFIKSVTTQKILRLNKYILNHSSEKWVKIKTIVSVNFDCQSCEVLVAQMDSDGIKGVSISRYYRIPKAAYSILERGAYFLTILEIIQDPGVKVWCLTCYTSCCIPTHLAEDK